MESPTSSNPRLSSPPAAPVVWINGFPGVGKRSIAESLSGLLGLDRAVVVTNCNYNGTSNVNPQTGFDESIAGAYTLPLPYAREIVPTPPLNTGPNGAALDTRLGSMDRPRTRSSSNMRRRSSTRTIPPSSKKTRLSVSSADGRAESLGGDGYHSPGLLSNFLPDSRATPTLSPDSHYRPPMRRASPLRHGPSNTSSRPRNPRSLYLDLSVVKGSSKDALSGAPASRESLVASANSQESGFTDYFSMGSRSTQHTGITGYPVDQAPLATPSVKREGAGRRRSCNLPTILFEANAKMSDSVRLKRRPLSIIGKPSSQCDFQWKDSFGSPQGSSLFLDNEVVISPGWAVSSRGGSPTILSRSNSVTSIWSSPHPDTRSSPLEMHMANSIAPTMYHFAGASFAPFGTILPSNGVFAPGEARKPSVAEFAVVKQRGKAKSEPRKPSPLSHEHITPKRPGVELGGAWISAVTLSHRRKRLSQPVPLHLPTLRRAPSGKLQPSDVQRQFEVEFPPYPSTLPNRKPTPHPAGLSRDQKRAERRRQAVDTYVMPPSLRTTAVIITDFETSSSSPGLTTLRCAAKDSGRPFVAIILHCDPDETALRLRSPERACCSGPHPAFGGRGPRHKIRDPELVPGPGANTSLYSIGLESEVERMKDGPADEAGHVWRGDAIEWLSVLSPNAELPGGKPSRDVSSAGKTGTSIPEQRQDTRISRASSDIGKNTSRLGPVAIASPGGEKMRSHCHGEDGGGQLTTASSPCSASRSPNILSRAACGEGVILVDQEGTVGVLSLDVTRLTANEAAGRIWQFLADADARCRLLGAEMR